MATEKKTADNITTVEAEPTVRVFIPLQQDSDNGVAIDQTETVVINGNVTQIKRGEYVDVKVPVFLQLRMRYPSI